MTLLFPVKNMSRNNHTNGRAPIINVAEQAAAWDVHFNRSRNQVIKHKNNIL
jgi:hypothetical protein